MPSVIPWEFYLSDLGRPLVDREINDFRLSPNETRKLLLVMERVANGSSKPDDVASLGKGLWEVRVSFNHRIGRILFSPELDQKLNLVLFAGIKKTQKTPSSWLALALSRRQKWRARQISV